MSTRSRSLACLTIRSTPLPLRSLVTIRFWNVEVSSLKSTPLVPCGDSRLVTECLATYATTSASGRNSQVSRLTQEPKIAIFIGPNPVGIPEQHPPGGASPALGIVHQQSYGHGKPDGDP